MHKNMLFGAINIYIEVAIKEVKIPTNVNWNRREA